MNEIVLLSDPRIAAVPVVDCDEPLVDLRVTAAGATVVALDDRLADPEGAYAYVRAGVAERLLTAGSRLPTGWRLVVVEGYRPLDLQRRYYAEYRDALAAEHPDWPATVLRRQASRYISPPEVAPHVAGAAVDLTLMTPGGALAWMGTEVNATPEESDGACFTGAGSIDGRARDHRDLLGDVLTAAGFVNYPTEWWHWSFGDRYWAFVTGASAARYGPVVLGSADRELERVVVTEELVEPCLIDPVHHGAGVLLVADALGEREA